MAKKELEEVEIETKVEPKSARQIRWEKYVEGYAVANPVKYAQKKARGEFDAVPASFA